MGDHDLRYRRHRLHRLAVGPAPGEARASIESDRPPRIGEQDFGQRLARFRGPAKRRFLHGIDSRLRHFHPSHWRAASESGKGGAVSRDRSAFHSGRGESRTRCRRSAFHLPERSAAGLDDAGLRRRARGGRSIDSRQRNESNLCAAVVRPRPRALVALRPSSVLQNRRTASADARIGKASWSHHDFANAPRSRLVGRESG